MNNLIPLRKSVVSGEVKQTVNARDLHEFLEIGKDFSTWIKDRIESFGFAENEDYVLTFPKIGERKNVKITEYHLSLDMAKELSLTDIIGHYISKNGEGLSNVKGRSTGQIKAEIGKVKADHDKEIGVAGVHQKNRIIQKKEGLNAQARDTDSKTIDNSREPYSTQEHKTGWGLPVLNSNSYRR